VLEIHPTGKLGDLSSLEDKVGTKVVAIKNISYSEPVFQGHFPDFSIFPGVMIVEAMAQASSFSVYPHLKANPAQKFQTILVGVDQARFRRPVIPGDTLRIETEAVKCRGRLWVFHCQASVDGSRAAEAQIMANLVLEGAS
jgi:3-hydroxyacyl-[acyl-carrier-protein] dehydratase